jgi:hypothetical protein
MERRGIVKENKNQKTIFRRMIFDGGQKLTVASAAAVANAFFICTRAITLVLLARCPRLPGRMAQASLQM